MSDAFKNLEKPGKNQGDQFRHTLPTFLHGKDIKPKKPEILGFFAAQTPKDFSVKP